VHQRAAPEDVIYRQGEQTDDVFVLCQGWALRVADVARARRHILSVMLPGDLFSATGLFSETLPFSVQALTDVIFTRYRRSDLRTRVSADVTLLDEVAKIGIAEYVGTVEAAIELGHISAEQRIARLLLRVAERLSARPITGAFRCAFPLHQPHIADMVGLTVTHVNRVLARLRKAGLAEVSRGSLEIRDSAGLRRVGGVA
jgi:CRP-like cAMP-binding protein